MATGFSPKPLRRLHHQHDVAGLHCGDDDLALRVVRAVDEHVSRCGAPVFFDGVGEFGRECGEPRAIVIGGQSNWVACQLSVGEPVRVLTAALDERMNQSVAVLRVHAGDVADGVAGVAHSPQQDNRARRGVESDRVADAGVLGRVRGEHDRHALVPRRDGAQPRVPHREARYACAAFRVGNVGDQAHVVNLLERERDRDDAPVELRHRHLRRDIERAEAVVVVLPGRPRAGQAQPLQDRDVQCGKVCHVPCVVIATRRHRGGDCAPGGQHGGHHRVGRFQHVQHLGLGGPQRGAVHRQRTATGVFDCAAQSFDVFGVACQLLGPVVEHGDRRAGTVDGRALQDAPARRGYRGAETESGHQHGVAQECVQLAEVFHAALGEIDVRLHGHAGRDGGMAHQVRVGHLLAADHHRRHAAADNGVDAVLPGPVAAEDAHHDEVNPVELIIELAVDEPRRVSPPILRVARPGGDQVGVGRRQQQNGGIWHPPFVPHRAHGVWHPVVGHECSSQNVRR